MPGTVTVLLQRWSDGDAAALEELTPFVYAELRSLAQSYLRRERPGHTLQPTELIHEAFLRLVDQEQHFRTRSHFFGVAAHLMRLILVDHARSRLAGKRGGSWDRVSLRHADAAAPVRDDEVLDLDDALNRLAQFDPRKSRAIELRYFGGLTADEIAATIGVSVATVTRDLRTAEAWLYRELEGPDRSGV